jgi:mannose-6-phosphate isomerase-like protein (cupin superfamily)
MLETIMRPDGFVAAAHVHPLQSERFEVVQGRLGLRVRDREILAGPGDVVTVEPGTPHRFWNAGESEALSLRGEARAPVRVADRDDVRLANEGRPTARGCLIRSGWQ